MEGVDSTGIYMTCSFTYLQSSFPGSIAQLDIDLRLKLRDV